MYFASWRKRGKGGCRTSTSVAVVLIVGCACNVTTLVGRFKTFSTIYGEKWMVDGQQAEMEMKMENESESTDIFEPPAVPGARKWLPCTLESGTTFRRGNCQSTAPSAAKGLRSGGTIDGTACSWALRGRTGWWWTGRFWWQFYRGWLTLELLFRCTAEMSEFFFP
jgi:hypothetical protein